MNATIKPTEYLQKLYLERRERNRFYSMRAFARDIGLSQAYVSMILNGKKPLTLKQATRISALLALEPEKTEAFLNAVLASTSKTMEKSNVRLSLSLSKNKNYGWFTDIKSDRLAAISRWYHLPILDLATTKTFRNDPKWIAARLGISPVEAADALGRLIRLGFLKRAGGKLEKAVLQCYFQTQHSETAIRAFHKEMIAKAASKLDQTSDKEFNKRSISGVTLAIDLKHLEAAKQKIKNFQQEMSELVTDGPCTEVYQLNVQFFPLTQDVKEK